MKGCCCQENGSDGTQTHTEPSGYNVDGLVTPCKNHIQNYISGWGKYRAVTLTDIKTGQTKTVTGEKVGRAKKSDSQRVAKAVRHAQNALTQLETRWNEFNSNPKPKVQPVSNGVGKYRGALKHIAKYGKNTALHTFSVPSFTGIKVYTVKQNLVGPMTCDCPDYAIRKKGTDDTCKHIDKVLANGKYALDLAYGQGAIESHRRLTDIANAALGTPATATQYLIEYNVGGKWITSAYSFGNKTHIKAQAEKIVERQSNSVIKYRMVPVSKAPVAPVESKLNPKVLLQWYDKRQKKYRPCVGNFDRDFAVYFCESRDGKNGSTKYRMVEIDNS